MTDHQQPSISAAASNAATSHCCGGSAPGIVKRVVNFLGAMAAETGAIIDGDQPVSAEEMARRRGICATCPFRRGHWCVNCGCYTPLKTAFRSQECNMGYWQQDFPFETESKRNNLRGDKVSPS